MLNYLQAFETRDYSELPVSKFRTYSNTEHRVVIRGKSLETRYIIFYVRSTF